MAEFKLHCFAQSGNAYKVALTMSCAGLAWEPVFVDFFKGATRDPAWRGATNAMGEVPVLEHAGKRMTQSGVILDYLSGMTGKFGARNDDERRDIWRWILFDNHKFTSYFATYRFLRALAPQAPDPAVLAFLKARADAAFSVVETHLAREPYMVAGRPTIADFSLAGYMFYPIEEHGYDFPSSHPSIYAWTRRMAALDGWKDPYALMPGTRFLAPR
jgi:glutathione S-transferase